MSDSIFYFAESLWPDLTVSNMLETSERLAQRLLEHDDTAFAQVVRDDKWRPLTPPRWTLSR
jgi:hypothetical protein